MLRALSTHLMLTASLQYTDIAGFTQWSSTREPEHVFTLLETLYAAFDALAAKRDVFKVRFKDNHHGLSSRVVVKILPKKYSFV